MKIGHLQMTQKGGERVFICECGHTLCTTMENFKLHVLKRDRSLKEVQPARFASRASNQFVMREYICPKCGTLFEVDVMPKDKPEDVPTMLIYNKERQKG